MPDKIPVIDFSPYLKGGDSQVPQAIGAACAKYGFFCLSNHGVAENLQKDLEAVSKRFFSLDEEEKMKISMKNGGRAWRGYFPVGQELTSGKADLKEGLYFGVELGPQDPRVQKDWPLHGANLFLHNLPELRKVVLEYIKEMTKLGHKLMEAISIALGLDAQYFYKHYTSDPTALFRIFHYPPSRPQIEKDFPWGVGEHTDYGLLTLLQQDNNGGLQVKTLNGWVDVPPEPGVFVCNVGDMLDFLTRGLYRSVPHRVQNISGQSRYSFPFFFDPKFDAPIHPLPLDDRLSNPRRDRWDGVDLYAFSGTYGEYLVKKVEKVFPDLATYTTKK